MVKIQQHVQNEQIRQLMERRSKYELAEKKFKADPNLGPAWYGPAVNYFNDQERLNPNGPVEQSYDNTVRYIQSLVAMGVKPPERKPVFASAQGDVYMPQIDHETQRQGGFPKEDPLKKLEQNKAYIQDRQLDLELRRAGRRGGADEVDRIVQEQRKALNNGGGVSSRFAG